MLPAIDPEIPDRTRHVIQRGRLRTACFFSDEDCVAYVGLLCKCAARSGCSVHTCVLMGNHVHLLLASSRANGGRPDAPPGRALRRPYRRHAA